MNHLKLIDRTAGADNVTVTIETTAMGEPITATLSARMRYAAIDGLLWWAMGRKLLALCNACAALPVHADLRTAQALSVAESLLTYVHTIGYHHADGKDFQRILRTITHYQAELQQLTKLGEPYAGEVRGIGELAKLIADRGKHEGEAMHGLEGIYQQRRAA